MASFALPQDAPISTLSSTTTTASGSTGASATSTINSNNVVMTKVVCGGICCAREVPIILEIMAKVPGVVKTSVNVPMKKVLIEHDLGTVSVSELTKTLNKEGFEVKKLETQQPTNTNTTTAAQAKSKNSTAGRSIFSIPQVSNETDVEIIKSLLAPLEGVLDVVSGAVAEGSDAPFLVQVDHELDKISAKTICEELNDLAFDATIQQDAFYTEQKNAAGELLGMEMENGNGRYMNIPSKVKSTIEVVASGEEKKESADENGHSHAHAHAGKVDGDSSSLLSLVKEHLRLIFVEDLRPFLSQTETDSLLESIRTNEKGHNTVQITIEHSPLPMPLRRIISGLEARSQGTYQIKSIEDGADDVAWNFPTLDNGNNKTNQDSDQDSHDHSGDDSPVLPKLPVTLSGVLWVVSYLSFFGGSW